MTVVNSLWYEHCHYQSGKLTALVAQSSVVLLKMSGGRNLFPLGFHVSFRLNKEFQNLRETVIHTNLQQERQIILPEGYWGNIGMWSQSRTVAESSKQVIDRRDIGFHPGTPCQTSK